MADDVAVTVRFGDEEPLVEFPSEGVTVSVPLTPVGDRLYRLDGVPVFAESASFGDVIEAEQGEGGRLRFVRVAERGGWRTYDFVLPAHKIEQRVGAVLTRGVDGARRALGASVRRVAILVHPARPRLGPLALGRDGLTVCGRGRIARCCWPLASV